MRTPILLQPGKYAKAGYAIVQGTKVLSNAGRLIKGSYVIGNVVADNIERYGIREEKFSWGQLGIDLLTVGLELFSMKGAAKGLKSSQAAFKSGLNTDVAAAGSLSFMDKNDAFYKNSRKRSDINPDGYFDVTAHGSPNSIEAGKNRILSPSETAQKIQANSGYTNGQGVRLLSCETGSLDNGFAQQLSNQLNAPVIAPTDILWAYPNGVMKIAPRMSYDPASSLFNYPNLNKQGYWRIFNPVY